MAGELDEAASKVAEMLWASGQQEIPAEILTLNGQTKAIVVDVDGVDYILTMARVPKQRPRPLTH